MEIRNAVVEDAPAACEVLRRSVSELCYADHLNDPAIVNRWLAHKTPEIVGRGLSSRAIRGSWQSRTAASLQWARSPTRVRSLSTMYRRTQGFVVLVEPCSLPFSETVERGIDRCTLLSTETAHRVYRSAGYVADRARQRKFGTTSSYPMSKRLTGKEGSGCQR
jgi:hypothetical protein